MQAFYDLIDGLAGPVTIFVGTLALVGALLKWYRVLTKPAVAGVILLLGIAFVLVGLGDPDFRLIVLKPDNVPIVIMIFAVGFFTWLSLRQAAVNDARIEQGQPPMEAEDSEKVLTWPDLVFVEFLCCVFFTALLVTWAIVLKAPLEPPSTPTETPNPSKAPWYFLGLQEMLVYFDPWLAGVVLPGGIIGGLIALPFIDPNPKGNGYYTVAERKFALGMFLFGFIVLWCSMITIGTFLRGPNWNFFGPFERWDIHKVEPLVNVNLSEYFWISWFGTGLPDNILVREAPGFVLVIGYLFLTPMLLARKLTRVDWVQSIQSSVPGPFGKVLAAPFAAKAMFADLYLRIGFVRYQVMVQLFLMMMSLPIKMVLRWTMNLKYLVAIPEYFFNI
jgi:hypothetical protein